MRTRTQEQGIKQPIFPKTKENKVSAKQKEVKKLSSKSTRTKAEETLLSKKKQELEELLAKQNNSDANSTKPSDKTGLVIELGA